MNELKKLREQIDAVDEQLKELILKRFQIVKEIGAFKAEQGIPLCDLAREEVVIQTVLGGLCGDERDALERVYREIISNGKKLQK